MRSGLLVWLSVVLMLAPGFAAQNVASPLERVDYDTTTIFAQPGIEWKPNDILAGGIWVQGDSDLALSIRYLCTEPTSSSPDSNCQLGEGTGALGSTRQVHLRLNVTGGSQFESATCNSANRQCQPLNSPANTLPTGRNPLTFAGVIPKAKLAGLNDGDNLTWIIQVPLTDADANCSPSPCQDPRHTTGETYYRARVDRSMPEIVVTDPSNANVFKGSETEWYLYSSQEMSNFLPVITVAIVDNEAGSPLNGGQDDFEILREGSDHTDVFDRTKVTDHGYAFAYRYSRAPAGESSFDDDSVTRFTIKGSDAAGHQMTATLWVAIDKTPPLLVVDQDRDGNCESSDSCVKRIGGKTGPAAIGEGVRVYINATDHAGRDSSNAIHESPGAALTVTARFQGGPDNGTFSEPITIPYNETLGYHHSPNLTIPSDWPSGWTFLNATVTDPVGNTVSDIILGALPVNISAPQFRPPRDLTATPGPFPLEITLNWNPPNDEGPQELASYSIFRGDDPEHLSRIANLPSDETRYTDEGLSQGTTYHYRVQAEYRSGEIGPFSNLASAKAELLPRGGDGVVGSELCGRPLIRSLIENASGLAGRCDSPRDYSPPHALDDADQDKLPDAAEAVLCQVENQQSQVDGTCTQDDYHAPVVPNPGDPQSQLCARPVVRAAIEGLSGLLGRCDGAAYVPPDHHNDSDGDALPDGSEWLLCRLENQNSDVDGRCTGDDHHW